MLFEALINRLIITLNAETNAEIEKYIDSTYLYYMRLSGLYPVINKKYFFLTLMQMVTYIGILLFHIYILMINSVYFFDISFVLFSQEVHFLCLSLIALILITMNLVARKDFARIHRYMMNDYYDYGEGESRVMRDLKTEMKRKRFRCMMVPLAALLNGGLVIVASRILDNVYGDFDAALYDINFKLPIPIRNSQVLDTSQGMGYLLAAGSQLVCITVIFPMAVTGAGIILIFVLSDYIRQFQFLLDKVRTAEQRAVTLHVNTYGHEPAEKGDKLYANVRFKKCYITSINKCIEHHTAVISVFENINNFMGFNFFLSFVVGSVIIALSANCVTNDSPLPGTTLANLTLCVNEIAFMYLLSMFGQEISNLSDEVRFEFYGLKWYRCGKELKQHLGIIQEGSFKTLTIMGAKILPVNFSTFSSVMNSAYSYYNLLNATG
nr:olfactory receptor 83 [Tropidothorax elegans]